MLSNSDIRKVQDNIYVVTTFNLQTAYIAQVSVEQENTQNKVKQTERRHIGGITSALRISLKVQTIAWTVLGILLWIFIKMLYLCCSIENSI